MLEKTNLLILCSDEHHPQMAGWRGHPWVETPNLDRLAARGVSFNRAYCNSSVCTPSRMSFITGKHVHEIASWGNGVPLDPAEMTWARWLDRAGIPSTLIGKMDFCGEYQDGGFTDHRIIRRRAAGAPFPRTEPHRTRMPDYRWPAMPRRVSDPGPRTDAVISDGDWSDEHDPRIGDYDHDRIVTNWALEYLRRKSEERGRELWACFVGLLMPHWPFRAPEAFYRRYYPDRVEWPVDCRFPNPDLHPAVLHYQRVLGLDAPPPREFLRQILAAYYGMVTCMDTLFGEILAELERHGLAGNTLVIYMSDHGEHLGEHGLFNKETAYEGSVGVPLILAGPGLPAGRTVDRPVSLIDLYPTVMDIFGLPVEPDRPGRSWLPLARNDPDEREDCVLSQYHGSFFTRDWSMLLRGDYKYVHYDGERPALFNLREDPDELSDLAGDPAQADRLADFDCRLREILNPEDVARRAKRDFGLIGPNGEDYTRMTSPGL